MPAGFRLMPGMPVTADVKVGKRTVLQYLLATRASGGTQEVCASHDAMRGWS